MLLSPDNTPSPAPRRRDGDLLTTEEINAAFAGSVCRTRVSLFYQAGLLVVTLAMVVLPLIYLAMIAAAGWATYLWATHFQFLLKPGVGGFRVLLLKIACYAGPLFAGVVLVFFMVKPLFARRAPHSQPLALNREGDPVLFEFITRICESVGAPAPRRIDLDCQLNASAGFRRGLWSLFSNDLVLTIGLPLVAGLDARQLAGVVAHEFGHFTQGFGMRLTYVIRTVNAWFARVIYERDAWDLMLEEMAETQEWWLAIVVGVARLAVWFSRCLLKLLMYLGHGIGCFMLRQMEYDADSYEIKLAGSAAFESAIARLHVLNSVLGKTYKEMRVGWTLNKHLPENFPAYLLRYDQQLSDGERTKLEDTMGLGRTGLFDTHPSNGDRIRAARQAGLPGVFNLDAPATALFANFEAVSKQVSYLHYEDDLGLPMGLAKLTAD